MTRLWLVLLVVVAGCRDAPPRTWTEPSTRMSFVLAPAGRFTMGSPPGEPGREAQERPHEVTLTRAFYIGRHEVTQAQWRVVMGGNPSTFAGRGGDHPVENVSYAEVAAFLERLNARAPAGVAFRLPTEAEWEYACRAGTTTAYHGGPTLRWSEANYNADPASAATHGTTAVGRFPPNAWGLHDMHGNVWEWTGDDHCPYPDGPARDPRASCGSGLKVIRGGSWYFGADSARCALRYTHPPADRGFSLGFRVVAVGFGL